MFSSYALRDRQKSNEKQMTTTVRHRTDGRTQTGRQHVGTYTGATLFSKTLRRCFTAETQTKRNNTTSVFLDIYTRRWKRMKNGKHETVFEQQFN